MKKNKITTSLITLSVFAAFIINSCNDTSNPPSPTDDSEVITTLKLELKDTISGVLYSYFFRDPDGEGGNSPVQWDTIKLDSQKVYKVVLKILNESNPNAIIDVSNEIKAEATSHIICFTPANTGLIVTRTDTDGTYPIGLESLWKSGKNSNGTLNIKLKHQPGLKNGSCDVGETDIDVNFPLKVY